MHLNVNSHFQHEILRCERVRICCSPYPSCTRKWLMKREHTDCVWGDAFVKMQIYESFIYYAALFSRCICICGSSSNCECECAWCASTKEWGSRWCSGSVWLKYNAFTILCTICVMGERRRSCSSNNNCTKVASNWKFLWITFSITTKFIILSLLCTHIQYFLSKRGFFCFCIF